MHDTEQSEESVPFVTSERCFGLNVCELVCGVNVFHLDHWVKIHLVNNNQSKAILWNRQTCHRRTPAVDSLSDCSIVFKGVQKASWRKILPSSSKCLADTTVGTDHFWPRPLFGRFQLVQKWGSEGWGPEGWPGRWGPEGWCPEPRKMGPRVVGPRRWGHPKGAGPNPVLGLSCEAPAAPKPPHISGHRRFKHHQNSTKGPPSEEERKQIVAGEGKKSAKFWAVRWRAVRWKGVGRGVGRGVGGSAQILDAPTKILNTHPTHTPQTHHTTDTPQHNTTQQHNNNGGSLTGWSWARGSGARRSMAQKTRHKQQIKVFWAKDGSHGLIKKKWYGPKVVWAKSGHCQMFPSRRKTSRLCDCLMDFHAFYATGLSCTVPLAATVLSVLTHVTPQKTNPTEPTQEIHPFQHSDQKYDL